MRKIAINVHRIYRGDKPSKLSEIIKREGKPILNLKTAKLVDYYPSVETVASMELVNNNGMKAKNFSFVELINLALAQNSSLDSQNKLMESTVYKSRQATNSLLPQISYSLSQSKIDKNQAGLSRAEDTLTSGLSLTQPIYNSDLYANLDIAENNFSLTQAKTKKIRNEVIVATAKAFLSLQRNIEQGKIELKNLNNAKLSLSLAKSRRKAGASLASDVYRWQIEEVAAKKAVFNARIQVDNSYNTLNKITNQELTTRYGLLDASHNSDFFKLLKTYFVKPKSIHEARKIRRFVARKSLNISPGVLEAKFSEKLSQDELSKKKMNLFAPTIFVSSEFSKIHKMKGIGNNGAFKDQNWNVALNLTFPILEGGAKHSRYKEEVYKVASATSNRRAVEQNFELDINNNFAEVLNQFQAVKFNTKSFELSEKNYEIVRAQYRQGKVSVLELLDSQETLRDFETSLVSSHFELMKTYVELQSQIGNFDFLMSNEEIVNWKNNYKNFK